VKIISSHTKFVDDDRRVPIKQHQSPDRGNGTQHKESPLPGWNEFQKAFQNCQGPASKSPSSSLKRKLKRETSN